MAKKRKQSAVEAWELFDINAPEEDAGTEPDGSGALPASKKARAAKPVASEAGKGGLARSVLTSPDKGGAKAHAPVPGSGAKGAAKKAVPAPEKAEKPAKERKKKKPLIKRIRRRLYLISEAVKDWSYDHLLPRRYKLTEEELAREKKRKLKRKKEEKKFRQARKELEKRRKAARKELNKRNRKKRKAIKKQTRTKRGFFRSIWALFDWYYTATTNPEEKENRIKPKIFGRTLTYTGFMILMGLLIVMIFVVLNNRTVDVERDEIVVTGLSDDFKGYNILVLSDLNAKNFGENQSTIQRLLSSEKYSLVLMLGDMVGPDGDTEPFYQLIDLFVEARKPVYFIAGDSDPPPLLETPREAGEGRTWREMVLSDWVLGAIEHGAVYVDCPMSITKGSSRMWLVPDSFLNLNVSDALNEYKDAYAQEQDAYLIGIEVAKNTLPLTYYRRNLLDKTRDNIVNSVSGSDIIIMLSHEVPSDSQITVAQGAKTESQRKNYFPAPDIIFAGHYCGGEWKLPLIGTLYVDSSILPRYGWFPDESFVQGQRSIGGTTIYTTIGLGNNAQTIFAGRLNNPPRLSLITLTGELPTSFLE